MQIITDTFDWSTIRRHLIAGLKIPSNSNPNRTFEIDRVESDKIFVWPMKCCGRPAQRSRLVSRGDFEIVVQHWNDYHSASGIAIPTWNNSYCLAIIAYVLEQLEGNPTTKRQE